MKPPRSVTVYGPMKQKTYETAMFDMIRTEFGYIGGPGILTLFVRKIVELNNEYYLPEHYIKPGQMRWVAVKVGQKYGRGKTMREMKLVPITLTIINEEDLDNAYNGMTVKELREKLIRRMHHEAREQGGVLTEADTALLLRTSRTRISDQIVAYEKRTGEIIPRCGTEMDMGKTLTHKKLAFHNFKKKMSTAENARSISHTPESVDRYIKDGTRVEKLLTAGYELWDIAYLTGLSLSLVNEYVEIVNEFKRKKEKAMKEHTKEKGVI